MKNFNRILLLIAFVLLGLKSYSQVHPYAYAVKMTGDASVSDRFYNIHSENEGTYNTQINAINPGGGCWNCGNQMFTGTDFGDFVINSAGLKYQGGEVKITHNPASNNFCTTRIEHRINDTFRGNIGTFSINSLPFKAQCNGGNVFTDGFGSCNGTSDWKKNNKENLNIDLTQRNEGTYELEIFLRLRGSNSNTTDCNTIATLNNGGANYKATFQICPKYNGNTLSHPTICDKADGQIVLTVEGIDDEADNDDSFFYGAGAGTAFENVVIATSGGVTTATISNLKAGTYTNVRYNNPGFSGCADIINTDITLNNPTLPVISNSNLTDPTTCSGVNGSIELSGLRNNITYGVTYTKDGAAPAITANFLSDGTGKLLINNLSAGAYTNISVSEDTTAPLNAACNSIVLAGPFNLSDPANPADATSSGDISQCETDPIQTLDANNAITAVAGHTIKWYDAAAAGNVVASPERNTVGETIYYAVLRNTTTGCESTTRTAVKLTIVAKPVVATSSGDISQCETDPIQTLDANNAITAVAGHTIKWYDAAVAGNVVASPERNTVGETTYYAVLRNTTTGCESTSRTAVKLTIVAKPVAATSSGDISQCETDPIQTLDANNAITAVAGHTIKWYDAAVAGNVVASPERNTVGETTYYAVLRNTSTGCESTSRTAVKLTIVTKPVVATSTGNITQCEASPIQTLDANNAITAVAGHTVKWYDAAAAGNVVATPTLNTVGATTYYAVLRNTTTGCESTTRTAVILTINGAPVVPTLAATDCTLGFNNASVEVTAPLGAGFTYQLDAGAFQAGVSFTGIANGSHTVTVKDSNGCESTTNSFNINCGCVGGPTAGLSAMSGSTCGVAPITISNNTFGGSATSATITHNGAGALNAALTAVSPFNIIYTPAAGDSGNTVTITVTTNNPLGAPCVAATPAYTLTVNATPADAVSTGNITQCETDPIQTLDANNAITAVAGHTVVWYDAAAAGNVVGSPERNTVGATTYYAVQKNNTTGCESTTRTAVTLTITGKPVDATSTGDITECESDPIQTLDANNAITAVAGHTIKWYDAAAAGNVVATPTRNTVGTTTYYAVLVSTATSCESTTRTAVTLTITGKPVDATSTGDITQCESDPIQTLNANNAITAVAGHTVKWYDAAAAGNVVATPTRNTVGATTYYAVLRSTATGCESTTRTAVTLTITGKPLDATSTGNITQCESDPIQTLDANNAITAVAGHTIKWYDATAAGNVVATPTRNTVGTTTYYAVLVSTATSCESTTRTAVTLTITGKPADATSTGDITQCESSPIQTLDANNAITAVAGHTVVWYDAAAAGNVVASPERNTVGATTYYAVLRSTATGCESTTRTAVTLTITGKPVDATSTGNITQCEASPIQTLDANNAITAVAGHTIKWYDAAAAGNVVATPTRNTVGTTTYYAVLVSTATSCESTTRTAVALTITGKPVDATSTGNITQCEVSPIQTLDANNAITAVAGHTVKWYDAAAAGNVVAPTLNTVGSTTYYAVLVSTATSCESTTRTAVTLTITGAPVDATSTGNISQCESSPIQTLDANNAITAVAGHTIKWYDAAAAGNVVATPTRNTVGSTTYYAVLVSTATSCESTTRTVVTLTITPAPVDATSTGNIVQCEASPIQTLDANDAITAVVGHTIKWYDAATAGNVVATPTRNTVGSTTYYAVLVNTTTSCESTTRTAVTVTITGKPVDATSTGNIVQCEASPIQTLDANNAITAVAGHTIKWYDAAAAGNVVVTPTRNTVGTTTYYAVLVSTATSCESTTRTAVTLTITGKPVDATSTGNIVQCEASPIQTLDANNAITAVAGHTVKWYDAAAAGNVVATPTRNTVGATTYYAVLVSTVTSCESTTRTAVTLTITGKPVDATSTGDITECESDPIQTLDANNAITAVAGHTVKWYDAVTAGNVVATPTRNTVGATTYYAVLVSTATSCESTTRTAVTLTITGKPVDATSTGDITECEASPIQTLDANNAITAVAGHTVKWYDAAAAGNIVATPTRNTVGATTYYAVLVSTATSCESTTRTAVTLTITGKPVDATSTGDITECEASPIQTLDANNAITAVAGHTVKWYDAAAAGNVVAAPTLNTVGTTTYHAVLLSTTTGCESTTRTAVTLTITGKPVDATSTGDITQCEASPIQTLNANNAITAVAGHTVVWYDAAVAGNVVATPTRNTVGATTYYAVLKSSATSCESTTRTAVTLTITGKPVDATSTGNITECESDPIQTLNANNAITAVAGHTVVWYDAAIGGNVVATPTRNTVGATTYYAVLKSSATSCESTTRTAVTLTINGAPITPVIDVNADIDCSLGFGNAVVTVPSPIGAQYTYSIDGGAFQASPSFASIANGSHTITVQDGNGCQSTSNSFAVSCGCVGGPVASLSTANGATCGLDPITISNNTFGASATQVTITHDGGGTLNQALSLVSPFDIIYTPVAGDSGNTVTITVTTDNPIGGLCVPATPSFSLTVNATPVNAISSGDITECESSPIQTLDANNAITAVAGHTVKWYDAAIAGNVVATPTLNTVGTSTYYAVQENNTTACESTIRTAVVLTINGAPVDATSTGDVTECELNPIQTLDANNAITPVVGHTVVWYDAAVAGNAVATPTQSTVGSSTYYAVLQNSTTNCESLIRTAVTLTLTGAPIDATSTGDITECELNPIQTLDANNAITAVVGHTVVWYDAITNGNAVAAPTQSTVGSTTYYAVLLNSTTNCESTTRTAVTLTITGAPIDVTSTGNIVECESSPIQTLDANTVITAVAGHTVVWYDAAVAGNSVATPTQSVVGSATYYAVLVNGTTNCESTTRTAVTLTITAAPLDATSSGDITECESSPIQTLNANNAISAVAGHTVVWYDALVAGNLVVTPTQSVVGSTTYYAVLKNSTTNCESTTRAAVTLTINGAPTAPVIDINTDIDCALGFGNAVVTVPSPLGAQYTYSMDGGAFQASPSFAGIGNGQHTITVQDGNGCQSTSNSFTVNCGCVGGPDASLSAANGATCGLDPITISNNAFGGSATQVTITHNGGGTLNQALSLVSPFDIIYTPVAGDSGNTVTITVTTDNPIGGLCVPATPTFSLSVNASPIQAVSTGDIVECEASPLQTLNANAAITALAGHTVVWYDAAINGNVVVAPTQSVIGSTTYYAVQSNNTTACESTIRTAVVLTINELPSVSVTSTNCDLGNDNAVVTVSSPIGAGFTYSIDGGAFQADTSFGGLSNGLHTITARNAQGCESTTNPFNVDCNCANGPQLTLSATIGETCGTTPVSISNNTFGGSATKVDITTDGLGTLNQTESLVSPFEIIYTPVAGDLGNDVTITVTTDNPLGGSCVAAQQVYTLTVNELPVDIVLINGGAQTVCKTIPTQTLDANDSVTPLAGHTVTWYDALIAGNVVANPILDAVGTITYYGTYVNDVTTCESTTRAAVVLTINDTPPPITVNPTQVFCLTDTPNPTIADIQVTAIGTNTIVWFDQLIGGTQLQATDVLTETTYYASQDDGTCQSSERLAVVIQSVCIVANDDVLVDVDASTGVIDILNVLDNDLLDGVNVVLTDVNLTESVGDNTGNLTLNPDGSIDVGTIINSGTFSLTYTICDVLNPTICDDGVVTISVLDSNVDMAITEYSTFIQLGPDEVRDLDNPYPFEPMDLILTVTNNGPGDATNVVVDVPLLPTGYMFQSSTGDYDFNTGIWTIGNVANGEIKTLTISTFVILLTGNLTDAVFASTATVSSFENDSDLSNNTASIAPTQRPLANIAVNLDVIDPDETTLVNEGLTPEVGGLVTFQIFVENAGSTAATQIELTNTLPDGFTYHSHVFEEGDGSEVFDPLTGKWMVDDLNQPANGNFDKSAILLLTAKVNALDITIDPQDFYTEHVDVYAAEDDPDLTNNEAKLTLTPIPQSDVTIRKNVDVLTPGVESEVEFTIEAINNGPSTATGVIVTDELPVGYTYKSNDSGGVYNSTTREIVWALGTLLDQETKTLKVKAEVNVASGTQDEYVNIARISANENDPHTPTDDTDPTFVNSTNTATAETVPVPMADLSIDMDVDTSEAFLNDLVTYTITVTNDGPSMAEDVLVDFTDFPVRVTYFSSESENGTYDNSTQTWSLPSLNSGEFVTFTLVGVVNDNVVNPSDLNEYDTITNTVEVSSITFDDDVTDDSNMATASFQFIPDCLLTIYNFVSANGDGKNDYFKIGNIDCYPNNNIEIFNRWGQKVYATTGYEDNATGNVFKGISIGEGAISADKELPSGTYFYILHYMQPLPDGSEIDIEHTGYIQLTR